MYLLRSTTFSSVSFMYTVMEGSTLTANDPEPTDADRSTMHTQDVSSDVTHYTKINFKWNTI